MNKSKLLTGALVIVLVLLAGGSWLLFGNSTGLNLANADQYTAGNTEIASSVENLDIDWTSGKVNIEYHAGSGITVSETANRTMSEDEKLRWWMDGKTLRVRYCKSGLNMHFNLTKTLTVSLPEGTVLKKSEIGVTSGEINIPKMDADEIVFDCTSGNVNAEINTGKLDASSTSGEMNIRQNGDIKNAVLKSTSGSIGFTAASAENVDMKSTSGNLDLTLSGNVENLRLASTSGMISADLASADKAEFDATSGIMNVKVLSFKDLDLDATSGNITLKLPGTPGFTLDLDAKPNKLNSSLAMVKDGSKYTFGDGSARLRIETTSGEIRIEK